jgi:hypothetical protein
MKFQLAATLLAFCGMASATTMHIVTLGKGGELQFCPEQITAEQGDLVQFQFYPKVATLCESIHLTHYRTTRSSKVSSPRAALPSRMPQPARPPLVSSPASCPSPPTQPKSPPSPSPSTEPPQNGTTAPRQTIASPVWSSPSTPRPQRPSPDSKPTAPTPPRISCLGRSLPCPHLHLRLPRQFLRHRPYQRIPPRQRDRVLPFPSIREVWRPHSHERAHGPCLVSSDV